MFPVRKGNITKSETRQVTGKGISESGKKMPFLSGWYACRRGAQLIEKNKLQFESQICNNFLTHWSKHVVIRWFCLI